ncbi:hypothetical protein [Xanthomonas phage JGB6]|nr:hypothetical protein [Xanthomonas phage JGB6]
MTTTTKTRATKEEIVDAFNALQSGLTDGKTVTREQFRKGSTISTSDVEYHFSTLLNSSVSLALHRPVPTPS